MFKKTEKGATSRNVDSSQSTNEFGCIDDSYKINLGDYLDCEVSGEERYVNHYKDWAEDYSARSRSQDFHPVEYYCGNMHYPINKGLRSGILDICFDRFVAALDKEISQAPRIPINTIVYRIIREDVINILKRLSSEGKYFLEPAFMSTTVLLSELIKKEDFNGARHALRIFVPKGARGIYIDQISTPHLMMEKEEHEIVFPRRSILRPYSYPVRLQQFPCITFFDMIMIG